MGTREYISEENDISKNECIICLENIGVTNAFRLNCGHIYHLDCWIEWSEKKKLSCM